MFPIDATECPDCHISDFVPVRDTPPAGKNCEYNDCEETANHVGSDSRYYCDEHYSSSGRDLRDRLQDLADKTFTEFGREAPKLTDKRIETAFVSGLKQSLRSTKYGQEQRAMYKEAMEQMKVIQAIKEAKAKGVDDPELNKLIEDLDKEEDEPDDDDKV